VVDALGLAKGTVYYYFPSKEDLLEAMVADLIDETTDRMQALVETEGGNALQKLRLLIQSGSLEDENKELLEGLHKPGSAGLHIRLLAAALVNQAPLFAALVEQGCREGLFHTETPLETSEFILGGVQLLTDMGIHPWSPDDLNRRMQALPSLIERLLGAPPGSFDFLLSS
jgi:AcrR family transcriptional regulator